MLGYNFDRLLCKISCTLILVLQLHNWTVSEASVLSKDGFETPTATFNDGCKLLLPSNRLFAPIVTDDATREVLQSIIDEGISDQYYIHVSKDRNIIVNCGVKDGLGINDTFNYMRLKCVLGNKFQDNEEDLVLLSDRIECRNLRRSSRTPNEIVIRNGTCLENGTNFDVDFETDSLPRKYYSSCVDEETSATFYSSSYLDGESFANGMSETSTRPAFRGKEFYTTFDINQAYNWEKSLKYHLSDLLGSEKLVQQYFPNRQYRFSRGHLFPNADGVKRYEKRATFYYMNTVPQWQNLNGGNWALVEREVRNFAKKTRKTLQVVTGSYGITTLNDENGNEVQLWLTRDKDGKLRVPVPKFVWKVVHDTDESAAVAIVQVNNPWVFDADSDVLCTDVCNKLSWLKSSKFRSIEKGYTYCCDVNELRKVISFIPGMKYLNLLGTEEIVAGEDDDVDSGIEDGGEDSDTYEDEPFVRKSGITIRRYGIIGSVKNYSSIKNSAHVDNVAKLAKLKIA